MKTTYPRLKGSPKRNTKASGSSARFVMASCLLAAIAGYVLATPVTRGASEPRNLISGIALKYPPASYAPLQESFEVSSRLVLDRGPPRIEVDLEQRRKGPFKVATSMIVFNDRGSEAVPEEKLPPRVTPPDHAKERFSFRLPGLPDGFYRADIVVGWIKEGAEDTVVHADVHFRVQAEGMQPVDHETWIKDSLSRFANKKE
jgi:hypothetical protein